MEESSDEKRLIRQLRNYRAADYVAGAGLLAVALLVGLLLWPAWYPNPERKYPPSPCKLNLKQIALALHNYHDQYKTFPPAFVNGPDGKAWHSWRVLILPFLGEEKLYAEYRFDEPWNGPRNSLLLKRRPDVFCCFGAKPHISPGHTSYSAIVGDGTAWPGLDRLESRCKTFKMASQTQSGWSRCVTQAFRGWLRMTSRSTKFVSRPPRLRGGIRRVGTLADFTFCCATEPFSL